MKSHEEEIQLVYDEAKTSQSANDMKVLELENKCKRYELEIAGASTLENEADILRGQVKALLTEMESEGLEHANVTHSLNQKGFKLRLQLEQTFRRTLKEMELQYRNSALETMKEESRQALHANRLLKEELEIQSTGTSQLLKRFDKHTEKMKADRVEMQLLQEAYNTLQGELSLCKRTCQIQDLKLKSMHGNISEVDGLKLTVNDLRSQVHTCKQESDSLRKELEVLRGSNTKWKKRALDLSRATNSPVVSSSQIMSKETNNRPSDVDERQDIDYKSYWNQSYPTSNGGVKVKKGVNIRSAPSLPAVHPNKSTKHLVV